MTTTPEPCPQGGTGVHSWIMRAAHACRKAGMSAEQATREIESRISRRPTPANEIETAVAKAFDCPRTPGGSFRQWPAAPKWPQTNTEQREAVIADGTGLVDLWEASPIRFANADPQTAEILRRMFPGDPWLCVGSKFDFHTLRLSAFAESAHAFEQLVPSPMIAKLGLTATGKQSQHTLAGTGPRRFIVVEQDEGTKDEQAAVLLHLAEKAPLALVCDSGGKSLHGWFFCAGKTDERLTPFFRKACTLGADSALWTRSQFARMPDATRDNGARQTVYFWNPALLKD